MNKNRAAEPKHRSWAFCKKPEPGLRLKFRSWSSVWNLEPELEPYIFER